MRPINNVLRNLFQGFKLGGLCFSTPDDIREIARGYFLITYKCYKVLINANKASGTSILETKGEYFFFFFRSLQALTAYLKQVVHFEREPPVFVLYRKYLRVYVVRLPAILLCPFISPLRWYVMYSKKEKLDHSPNVCKLCRMPKWDNLLFELDCCFRLTALFFISWQASVWVL